MDLTHTFTVPAPVEDTWAAFNDLESVAGCFPGASLSSVDGDDFKGSCKVKLGPIALVYNGSGRFVERDTATHRFVIEANGKDKRGNGTAGATVTAVLTAASRTTTDVEVTTDLAITGKPAQFGRGVIQDVSDKLLQQFVACLESRVAGPAGPEPAAAEPAAPEPAAAEPAAPETEAPESAPTQRARAGTPSGRHAAAEETGAPPKTDGGAARAERPPQASDPLDLGATVVPVLVRTYWRPALGALAVLFVLGWLLRRRR